MATRAERKIWSQKAKFGWLVTAAMGVAEAAKEYRAVVDVIYKHFIQELRKLDNALKPYRVDEQLAKEHHKKGRHPKAPPRKR